uniref:Uncharacterized protein n=1 Tax=Panagrolaimus sp. ES5 TaxID=591445 RepID=A0AC34FHN0_9BILA
MEAKNPCPLIPSFICVNIYARQHGQQSHGLQSHSHFFVPSHEHPSQHLQFLHAGFIFDSIKISRIRSRKVQ